MTRTRIVSSTILAAAFALAATASAQDKKAAAPAATGAKPAAAPAAAKAAAPAAAAAAPAAPAAPAGPPTPSAELAAFMKGFEGSWKCEAKMMAGAMGPGTPEMTLKSTAKFKKENNGFNWHGDYEIAKTKASPAIKFAFKVLYDSTAKQAIVMGTDNMGGYSFGAGPITGETVSYTGEQLQNGVKTKTREVMGLKGPKEGFHKLEVDMGKGFQLVGEDTCKK